MEKTLVTQVAVLLTLAICFGIAAAPTVAASCPPSTGGPQCAAVPVSNFINCTSERAGDIVDQILTDCI